MKDSMSERIGYAFDLDKLGKAMLEREEYPEDFRDDCPFCPTGQIVEGKCNQCGDEVEFV